MEEINLNLVLMDYQEILSQNVHAAKWHEFFLPDLSNFVRQQLAKSKYYGLKTIAHKLEERIVKYFFMIILHFFDKNWKFSY